MLQDGIERTMVWFRLADRAVPASGDAVLCGGKQVGRVTSGSYSPTLDRGVAMAYVEPRFALRGAVFTVRAGGADHMATLSTMPLYDPGDVRSRGR